MSRRPPMPADAAPCHSTQQGIMTLEYALEVALHIYRLHV